MARPYQHIVHQGPLLTTLGKTALMALRQKLIKNGSANKLVVPSPELTATVAPPPAALVRDYVRHVGGDPGAYKNTLPPHLWPQWGFPWAARTLEGIPYPIAKVLNGGCRIESNAPLPQGEPLLVRARLEDIDDNGQRAVLHQRVVTGTASQPDALVAHLYAIVPLRRDKSGPPREPERVPKDAAELSYWKLRRDAGLEFAMLTGDFNPIHWIGPYAKAFGFKDVILHGFSTMARAYEGLVRGRFVGDANAIRMLDVKFTRPLLLPRQVGLYVVHQELFVGDALGGPAYLTGKYEPRAV